MSEYPDAQLVELNKYFSLKPGSIMPPKLYMGAKTSEYELPNGIKAWSISTSKYIQDAVKNVERRLADMGLKLNPGGNAPITNGYRPEVDVSPVLNSDDTNFYQSLIGTLRWMVEMGRIDMACEVSVLSSCLAMPRQGHLQQVLNIFAYLKRHHNSRLIMDPTYPDIPLDDFPDYD